MITEVKCLELNQFSDRSNLLGSSKCCCRKVGNVGCPFEVPFPLGLVHLVKKNREIPTFYSINFALYQDPGVAVTDPGPLL